MKQFLCLITCLYALAATAEQQTPETGISGVYEVMVATDRAQQTIDYFSEYGFSVVKQADITAGEAKTIYGVDSALTSYRLQNGDTDTHGLLRILAWKNPLGPGVGFAPPETVGMRMAVMRTRDIVRLADVYADLREKAEQPWLLAGPVYDDLYKATEGTPSISNRRVGVREMAVYGQQFNHVFFQRYGYTIPGYGSIGEQSPLQTSEFTHHDFFVKGNLAQVTDYYISVLGLTAENDPVIDGEWQAGPKVVFQMDSGRSHWYRGFVSKNNICGKLKIFSTHGLHNVDDRSSNQRPGELGITLHSLWTPKLQMVHSLAIKYGLQPSAITSNEFNESSFLFKGPDGVSWQIIGREQGAKAPVTQFHFRKVNN